MKKLLFAACLAAFCLTSCNNGKNNTQNLANQQNDSLNSIIAQKDSEINDMMGTLNEIQDGLNQISEAEHRVTILKNSEGASKRQQLKEDVQFIATRMQQNRELLAKLQKQMANSSLQADQLKKTIANLQEQIAQKDKELQALREELDKKDIHIAALDETINNLNTKTSRLTTESSQKSETINAQEKGKVMTGNFNKSYFTKVDIRNISEIKLMSKSAKLLTTHPSSSYALVRDANKQYTLRITNPQIFWSTSKYLVVLVK